MDRLMDQASPEKIAQAAKDYDCKSVAFTYNDPVIFAEYAIDTANACHELGIQTVAVTAGYIAPEARQEFFSVIDAANVDLKAFTEAFYFKLTGAHLQPVLDTLVYLHHETKVWTEITTLIIPGHNDSNQEIEALAKWVAKEMGPDVPLHFSAFHPDFKMIDVPPTPPETLRRARQIAREQGLHYVYTGNVHDREGDTTYCPGCQKPIIVRDWYDILTCEVTDDGHCPHCQAEIAGRFEKYEGAFGQRRIPVRMSMR